MQSQGAGGPTEVTLGCQTHGGREGTVAARTSSGTHRGIHSLAATAPLTRLVHPQQQTELSVLVPESGLHRINCNNWQVGLWLLGFNSPGAHEKKNLAVPLQPVFSLGSKKLQLSMTRNKRCGCSCPGKTRAPEQPWRKRPHLANSQFAPWGQKRKLPLNCCPSWEHQIMEEK